VLAVFCFACFSFARDLIVRRVSEATSPKSPPMMISHKVSEIPGNGLHNKQLLFEPPPDPPEEQLVVHAPKALSKFGALASLEVSDDNPHAASIVDR
jgi:hypothetical protein